MQSPNLRLYLRLFEKHISSNRDQQREFRHSIKDKVPIYLTYYVSFLITENNLQSETNENEKNVHAASYLH